MTPQRRRPGGTSMLVPQPEQLVPTTQPALTVAPEAPSAPAPPAPDAVDDTQAEDSTPASDPLEALTVRIPRSLRRELKVYAATHNRPVQELAAEAIRRLLASDNSNPTS